MIKSVVTARILIFGVFLGWMLAARADERLWMQAEINGKPVRLCFDSGASDLILLDACARRLGLTVSWPPTNVVLQPGQVLAGTTEECLFRLQDNKLKTRFRVFKAPAYLGAEFDGVLGWAPLHRNRFKIDAEAGTVTLLAKVPREALTWTKLLVVRKAVCLELELPGSNGPPSTLFVDTGDDRGVGLVPHDWREWRRSHAGAPVTLTAFFTPGTGLLVKEEGWANKLELGPLVLSGVPVTEAMPVAMVAPRFQASLGLAALRRLHVVIDGKGDVAYVRPKHTVAPAYGHNRLGAVFVPATGNSDDLIAQVAEGSPAQEAGIRAGDVLLKIDEVDATKWRTDPTVLPLSRFLNRPAGTRLDLTLKREGQTLQISAVLRDILSPESCKRQP